MKKIWILIIVCITMTGNVIAQEELTYINLVHKLIDLEGLSVLPVPGEKCAQWSSYDRASRYNAASDTYIDWDSNADGDGIIRRERDLAVLAEMEGPGCIWRIWSANASHARVKIYLDGKSEPVVDLPFEGYFNCRNSPFTYSSLVYTVPELTEAVPGYNCFIPIPYQESCKIVTDGHNGGFYHFTYSTFPAGTVVPTFTRHLSAEEMEALETVNNFLENNLGTDPAGERYGKITESKTVTIPPGSVATVTDVSGEGAITAIKVKINTRDRREECDALRELVLRITWDYDVNPSVLVPLGDFFGTAPGINRYTSLPLGMTDDEFYSYWYMPFSHHALVELVNDGNTEYPVEFSITHAPLSRPVEELGRFHAKWHRDAFLPEEPGRSYIDWTLLKTQGRGRFCGIMLHVWNPNGGWWGEGDEKFFVDGEKFPSTFGTGSEDYFGYAWSNPELFQSPYHNQTFNSGDNNGHISLNRWHIADNVPFQTSFEGAIEKYYSNEGETLYACVAYWYLSAHSSDSYEPVPLHERVGYYELNEMTTGDVNNSGSVNIIDAFLVAQYYVGLHPKGFNLEYADTNCDGDINIIDALLIAQYYVRLIDTLC
jgi:hypothetical protein